MIQPAELRIGNYFQEDEEEINPSSIHVHTVSLLTEDRQGKLVVMDEIRDIHPTEEVFPIPITEGWLLAFGFEKELVCETCGKINSRLCYKGQKVGDFQFQEQAIKNGLYADCEEPKKERGELNLNGFYIFKGKTIQSWSKEVSWNFGNNSWNLNLTTTYIHQLQNLYFALTGKELTRVLSPIES